MSAAPAGEASAVFASEVRGPGSGEVPRIRLEPGAVAAIIEREIEDRRRAAAEYRTLGQQEEADILAAQIDLLVSLAGRSGTTAHGPM
jgi:uncharacterized protein YqeY